MKHDEWILYIYYQHVIIRYSSVLKDNGWFDDTKWLDIRGNHDTFVHYEGEHPYKKHTVFGYYGKGSVYSTIFKTDTGYLRFIGIDANGPLYRHFNGFLTRDMLDALEDLLMTSEYVSNSRLIVVFQPFFSVTTLFSPWTCEHSLPVTTHLPTFFNFTNHSIIYVVICTQHWVE